jgi:hypothetical protein
MSKRSRTADEEWSAVLAALPSGVELEDSARRLGALARGRKIRDAASLLRLVLGYAAGGRSLRGTAAWAETSGLAALSNPAVLKRVRKAEPWLAWLVGATIADRVPAGAGSLRLIDATTLTAPGGREWRLHMSYGVAEGAIAPLTLTTKREAEGLGRFTFARGEIAVADRAYARAGDLAAVREQGAHFIVRAGWNAVRWRRRDGGAFDLLAALDGLRAGGVRAFDIAVAVDRAGRTLLPMRLIVRRNAGAAAAAAEHKAARKAKRQGKAIKPATLIAAGYILLLTSLDKATYPARRVLGLYRRRWQIELLFKRLKSMFRIDALPAKDPAVARCWIYANLLAALLVERIARHALDSSPSAS